MAKTVVLDEIHLTIRIPRNLSDTQAESIRQTLTSADFMARLRRVVRSAFHDFPELNAVRVSSSR